MGVSEVIAGTDRWAVERGDARAWLAGLPDDCADLLFCSPPYEAARTYGIDFRLSGEDWVKWMFGIVTAATAKVKGVIAVVCEGQTRGYRYSAAPFLLMADLHRAGLNLRKPPVYHRLGIPGSGGPDWFRNDWEPIVCITPPGRLPYSDPTACGHPPKYGPGGAMSNRTTSGRRVSIGSGKRANGNGKGRAEDRPGYDPPAVANPGNVIRCKVGGGHMGHELAHENEAPFPLDLAAFFVRTFCPPGGLVLDCFAGSGTTGHAALDNGRRFAGCDIRESQCALTRKRLGLVTPSMF